jgi:hypothetical protein
LLPSIQSITFATAMILDGGGSRCHGLVGHDSIALGAGQHRLGGAADGCCHG